MPDQSNSKSDGSRIRWTRTDVAGDGGRVQAEVRIWSDRGAGTQSATTLNLSRYRPYLH